ncbi:MAG: LiaI-LiaF-like domain-containing protein [Burkholderiales bacterium]
MRSKSKIGALVLIVLGVLFLLSNFGWIPRVGPLLARWWPAILIIVGVYMLVQR